MMVDEHGIQTFKVVVVVLLFLLLFDILSCNIFGQAVCPNVLKCHYGSEVFSDILSWALKGQCENWHVQMIIAKVIRSIHELNDSWDTTVCLDQYGTREI